MAKFKRKLSPHERPLTGVATLLRAELSRVDKLLESGPLDALTEGQVHEVRKLSKSSRALWRLLRAVVDTAHFEWFDAYVAHAARHFAGSREQVVRMATFTRLVEGTTVAASTVARVRHFLSLVTPEHEVRSQPLPLAPALPKLDIPSKGQAKLLARALRRSYRRGRRTLDHAMKIPNDAELLHDFRKQVKYYLNQLSVLRASSKLRKRRTELHALADLLGAHHDLIDLRAYVERATPADLPVEDVSLVIALLQTRASALAAQAFVLGRSRYRRRPRSAMRRLIEESPSLR
jgi:hypothetical protein